MRLSEIKAILPTLDSLVFSLPNGDIVPSHFHVTEVGRVTKKFIDCGGTIREDEVINFQLWTADDIDHRLQPQKLLDIIELSEKHLDIIDGEVEVEYQGNTIEKYALSFEENNFSLVAKYTDCLASDKCMVPDEKPKVNLADLTASANTCTPGSGCC